MVAPLRALNPDTGALSPMAVIDSDTHDASVGQPDSYVDQYACLTVDSDLQFDEWRYAYDLDTDLWKTSRANFGGMAVQICNPAGACQEGI